jgi:hypothetical protein
MEAEGSICLSLFLGLEVEVLVKARVVPRKKVSSNLKPAINLSIEAKAGNISFSTKTAVSHQILPHVLHVGRCTRTQPNYTSI